MSSGSRLIRDIELAPSSTKPSGTVDPHRELAPAHVVDAEMRVEQADERPDRARRRCCPLPC
jgi:hypothetical protein